MARTEINVARTEQDQMTGGMQTGCQLLADLVPTMMEIRGRMDAVTTQICEMEAAPQIAVAIMERIRGEMADRDQRMQA